VTNPREPVLCLVTNRRRLAAATAIPGDGLTALVAQVSGAIRGGVDLVQIREPDLDGATLLRLTRQLLGLRRTERVRIVVNDRLDVALAAGADGVHLRAAGMPPDRVRRMAGPGFLIGRSVHSAEEAQQCTGVDYLIAGPVLDSVSKPGYRPLGADGFQTIVRAAGSTSVLAIGGVTEASVGLTRRAGAAGIAAIGAFIPARPVDDVHAAVKKLTKALRFALTGGSTFPNIGTDH
jgi:thiamine-phosphate pyrophosphorylase